MSHMQARMELEERGRAAQLEHLCRELVVVQGLEERLAQGLNEFEVRGMSADSIVIYSTQGSS